MLTPPFYHLVGTRHSPNEFYGRFVGMPGSICFDARELHHLAPLFGFLGNEPPKVGG